jgi:hypothetical protein
MGYRFARHQQRANRLRRLQARVRPFLSSPSQLPADGGDRQLSKRDPTTRARSRVLSAGCILVEASFVSWLGVSAYFAVILWSISIWTKVDPPDNVVRRPRGSVGSA